MLSNSSKYAIKAVLFIAIKSQDQNKFMVKDLAKLIKVPQPYIAKLLQELSRRDIISSTRGPKGGFFLSESNKAQPLINVVNAIDGDMRLQSCVLGLEKCNQEKPCPLHDVVYPTKSKFVAYLESMTIGSFAEQFDSDSTYF